MDKLFRFEQFAFVKINGSDTMYYVHSDFQGSFDKITNQSGTVVASFSFDAWGRRRNPADWTYNNVPSNYLFSRGYTGHEHLDVFALINMNGRVYDPLLGRMLSPDAFVQNPGATQAFNRYAYVMNNPLTYSNPTGMLSALDVCEYMWEQTPYGANYSWDKSGLTHTDLGPISLVGGWDGEGVTVSLAREGGGSGSGVSPKFTNFQNVPKKEKIVKHKY